MVSFPITGDPAADRLLVEDPLALLLGMLLDQQVPMEWAFSAPYALKARLGESFTAARIAELGPEALTAAFVAKPALHRYPGSMAKRAHALCVLLAERYDGDPTRIWTEAATGRDLLRRVKELPGFGDEKAKIFTALLAKRFGVRPEGWEEAAKPFSDDTPRSAADVDSAESLAKVRDWKRMMKAAGKGKQD
ncbi:MAG: HhH-GPD-type base excision DNA repair protein [Acidimicrobiales bacterium]